jgi:Domain of unknown function (DUF222)/HNH endonuclease
MRSQLELPDLTGVPDRDLLLGGRFDVVAENRAGAQRWARLVEFFRRRDREHPAKEHASPHFALTARQETVVEVGELWGVSEAWLRKQLNVALCLVEHFPEVWQLCLAGELDGYRATLIADAARSNLDQPDEYWRFARRITRFLVRHRRAVDGVDESPLLVQCTIRQLRNKIAYELRLLRQGDAEERFRKRYADRRVSGHDDEDGMSWLSINHTIDQIRVAHHRLTLAAKQKRASGDERTLDQLRADLAMELLTGQGEAAPLPAYARPIVNVTVPIQTLMGISDDPGILSGGTAIPAGLTRMIAARPGSTWHRMLTDPAGRMVELSTKSYQPTGPIWSWVVAEHSTCFRPGCDVPATEAEVDHRVRWPEGPTDPENLWPGCKTDHKAKHAPGFAIEQCTDGSYRLRTPTGFRHPITRPEHPVSDVFDDITAPEGFQFSATEIVEAISYLREADADQRPLDLTQMWEAGCDEALDDALDNLYAVA